jgi:chaperonin GroEL
MTYKQVLFRSAARERVVRVGLESAMSVASVLLLTEATMTEIEEPRSDHGHPGDMEM